MKLTIKIFTLYLLVMSLVPCGDGGGGILEIANHLLGTEHQHISDHDQHSNGCGDDTCSPFCVCSCCSISINIATNTELKDNYIILISRNVLSYNSDFYPSSFSSSIWQPPKFS